MKTNKVHRWLNIVLLLVAIGIISAIIVPTLLMFWDTFGVKYPNLEYITKYTEINFPPNSQLVRSYSLGGQDRSIEAVVKIKRDDVSRFISDLRKTTLIMNENCREKDGWFFYSQPKHPKSGDTHCQIRIRESDPHHASVSLDGVLF